MPFRAFRFLRNLRRSREIATVLLMHGFADFVDRVGFGKYVRWGKRLVFWWRKEPVNRYTRAHRIRMSLEKLGATFIKFGQVMSTRPDLVPDDVIKQLERLQENVPPFSGEVATAVIEQELEAKIEDLFAEFDVEPLAAGSLGQVHRAVLPDGTVVAVKVRRPRVVHQVEQDISLMQELAALAENYIPEAAVFDPVGLVDHFSRTIRRELSFTREARSCEEFARMFKNDATLKVPNVYWDLTTDAVLTIEFLDGHRVAPDTDWSHVFISRPDVAANGARIFMKQAFEFGLFHGDPHPGNFRVMKDGSIGLLDYGMVGTLDEEKRELLVDMLVAISRKDAAGVVEVMQLLGQPSCPIDLPLLRSDVRDFVNNYYDVSLERLNIGNMLRDFIRILSSHSIRCPGDLMLLIRALIALEGVGRELDAGFNLAAHLAPFIEDVIKERYSPRRLLKRIWGEAKRFSRVAHDLPLSINRTLEKLSKDELRIQLEHRSLNYLVRELDRSSNRVVMSVIVASLVIAAAMTFQAGSNHSLWFSIPAYALSSLLGMWLIYGIFRSGRL